MRWGFVLDQHACIGCHACTVACKAENGVPLGAFRTWVKWIEHGTFPDTRRSAAVLRCNHCAEAPCIEICPTRALFKRGDGIVDLDGGSCIGCSSCLQACPYDAIYIDPEEGTAAKCHFCAHRLEVDLAPACVAVCPEQAIWVVDLDLETTRAELDLRGATVRKPERGTRPQTFYLGADPAALDPLAVDGSRTLSHAEVPDPLPAPGTAEARAVYDVPRVRHWGAGIAAYMATKAVAAGALLAAALSPWRTTANPVAMGWLSLLFTAATVLLLIGDLGRPRRFLYLLTRPNPSSWLVRGAWILMAHGALSAAWALGGSGAPLALASAAVAALTAVYTAYLFRQARGRELWCEDRLLPLVLLVQAVVAADVLAPARGLHPSFWLPSYLGIMLATAAVRPSTRQARLAHARMLRRPLFWSGFLFTLGAFWWPPLLAAAFFAFDHAYVEAGQEVALS